jgi:hypothetical protein
MKPSIVLACALFAANGIFADPYSAAIQQAKRVSHQETESNRRLIENPPPTPQPQSGPSQTADPVLQATLKNIHNLQSDFATLARLTSTASITTEKQGLTNDLAVAALGKKPSPQSLVKLADDLAAVIVGSNKLLPQHLKLAQYVHAISNSSQLTEAQQQMIFTDTQKILVTGGAKPDDAAKVVNDIKTIASETK